MRKDGGSVRARAIDGRGGKRDAPPPAAPPRPESNTSPLGVFAKGPLIFGSWTIIAIQIFTQTP
jgi:hypothetical protein